MLMKVIISMVVLLGSLVGLYKYFFFVGDIVCIGFVRVI